MAVSAVAISLAGASRSWTGKIGVTGVGAGTVMLVETIDKSELKNCWRSQKENL
jgi:hypothetical protein